MSELTETRAALRLNHMKLSALRAFQQHAEGSALKLGEDLARAGYSQAEILEVFEACRPNFEEGAKAALRAVTIAELMMSANDG